MKRLQLSAENRERLLSGPVTVRRAVRPEPGDGVVKIAPSFERDQYWRDYRKVAGYAGLGYCMLPARKPPYSPGEVVYVPEWWFQNFCQCCDLGCDSSPCTCMDPPLYRADSDCWDYLIQWKSAASMPAWAARLFAKCVSVEAVKGERWEWVCTFERCEQARKEVGE